MQEFILKLAPHLWSLAALLATSVVLPALPCCSSSCTRRRRTSFRYSIGEVLRKRRKPANSERLLTPTCSAISTMEIGSWACSSM